MSDQSTAIGAAITALLGSGGIWVWLARRGDVAARSRQQDREAAIRWREELRQEVVDANQRIDLLDQRVANERAEADTWRAKYWDEVSVRRKAEADLTLMAAEVERLSDELAMLRRQLGLPPRSEGTGDRA